MSVSFDECADVWHEYTRVARKEHTCCACSETICPGNRYGLTQWVYDGTAGTYKRCARCELMYSKLCQLPVCDWTEGIDPRLACGHSWEDVREGPVPPEMVELAFLTPDEAQERIAEMIERRGKLMVVPK